MDNKMFTFSSLLGDLVEQAQISGNVLELSFIKDFFSELDLGEKEFQHIYAYLKASHIDIIGLQMEEETLKEVEAYKKAAKERLESFENEESEEVKENLSSSEADLTKVESSFLKMYFEDLSALKKLTPEEEDRLLEKIIDGDEQAELEYTERKLHDVVKKAKDFGLSEAYFEELIEEGNIGLLLGIGKLKASGNRNNPKEDIDAEILSTMQDFIDESLEAENSANSMISKVGFVSDAAKKLKEDKGKNPSLMELAAYTNLSEEELLEIMKLSADALMEK